MEDETQFLITVSSEEKPSLERCCKFVSHSSCGAISTFTGITRDCLEDRIVTNLSYEGYVPMAVKELFKLCTEAKAKYHVHRIAVQHILGNCPVGEESVVIAASSPHRRNAIDCVAFLIDELKATVPIWKLEVYQNEESVWKENIEWHNGRRRRVMRKQESEEAWIRIQTWPSTVFDKLFWKHQRNAYDANAVSNIGVSTIRVQLGLLVSARCTRIKLPTALKNASGLLAELWVTNRDTWSNPIVYNHLKHMSLDSTMPPA